VLLIDADPQQSSMKWSTFRAGENKFSVAAMAKPTLHKELGPICADYTDIVIDGPRRIHELATSTILAADVIVIPVRSASPRSNSSEERHAKEG
jgi:chromosome partitioning protein